MPKPHGKSSVKEMKDYIRKHGLNKPQIRLSQNKAGLVAGLKKVGHWDKKHDKKPVLKAPKTTPGKTTMSVKPYGAGKTTFKKKAGEPTWAMVDGIPAQIDYNKAKGDAVYWAHTDHPPKWYNQMEPIGKLPISQVKAKIEWRKLDYMSNDFQQTARFWDAVKKEWKGLTPAVKEKRIKMMKNWHKH